MIVEPDFLEHWKTRLLVRLLGTEEAPLYVIRLWAHCQHRKTDRFTGWNPDVLASVCRWVGPAETFWSAMGQTFLDIQGDKVVAHDWNIANASLIAAWENGKKGGRPSKKRHTKPTGNPSVIHQDTQGQTDREEKRREDGMDKTEDKRGASARFTPPTREELDLAAAKIGLASAEVDKFVAYYGSNGWRVGRNPMRSWQHALTRWKLTSDEHRRTGSAGHGRPTVSELRNATLDERDVAAVRANAAASAERQRKRLEEDPDYIPI